MSDGWQDYVAPKGGDWQDYQPPRDTIGVNRGSQTSSPGYRYSTGYAGPNDEQRASGGFIDRMTTAAGQSLQNPGNFIPDRRAFEGLLSTLDPRTWKEYRALHDRLTDPNAKTEDLAKVLGNATPAVLTALVTHAADALSNPVKAGAEAPTAEVKAQPAQESAPTFEAGKITPQGWYYLGRMEELAKRISEQEASVKPKNITPSQAAKLTKPVTPPASTEDLSPLLQEMLKRVTAAKGKLSDLQ